jgi:uncharacterized protein YxeA
MLRLEGRVPCSRRILYLTAIRNFINKQGVRIIMVRRLNRKAQGLPITTIALIIIVLVVLAAVAIFFFMYFTKSSGSTDYFNCQQLCQAEKAYQADRGTWSNATNVSGTSYCKQGCKTTMGSCTYNTSAILTCP